MIAPTTAWRTAVRTTALVTLTTGLLIAGNASAQAAAPPAPTDSAGLIPGLLTQVNNVLSGVLSGDAVTTLLPSGILGG